MLKRPNPYRKTRAKGTIDDLMFDMDKRRHTSFRFQNYQNFITDRPGKMDERYRQKLSWCALDEETGKLDYLTEGLSPNNGRRMSTSSVGSRGTAGGDRDSLLPSWDALKSNTTEGGKSGDGGEDDSGSVAAREDSGALSPSSRGIRSPPLSSGFASPPLTDDGGSAIGRSTPKPNSGRSWVTPKFAIDLENRTPSVLHEDSPEGGEGVPPKPPSLPEHRVAAGNGRYGTSLSLSPPRRRFNLQQALTPSSTSNSTSGTLSSSAAGRRSPPSFGTSSARLSGSLPTRSSDDSGIKSRGGNVGIPIAGTAAGAGLRDGERPAGDAVVGGDGGGMSPPGDVSVAFPPLAFCGDNGSDGSDGSDSVAGAGSLELGRGAFDSAAEIVPVGDAADIGASGAAEASEAANKRKERVSPVEEGIMVVAAPEVVSQEAVSVSPAGREPSYGTVSNSFLSGAASDLNTNANSDENNSNGSGNYPRQSEESTYFSSTASTIQAPDLSSTRTSLASAIPAGRVGMVGAGGGGGNASVERRSASTEPSVTLASVDPGVLLRPPLVDDGKLKHDRERRLGVANDLEAVIAELSRRKSLLAWEDGEGASARGSDVSSSTAGGDSGKDPPKEGKTREPESTMKDRRCLQARSSSEEIADSRVLTPPQDNRPAASAAPPAAVSPVPTTGSANTTGGETIATANRKVATSNAQLATPPLDPRAIGAKRTKETKNAATTATDFATSGATAGAASTAARETTASSSKVVTGGAPTTESMGKVTNMAVKRYGKKGNEGSVNSSRDTSPRKEHIVDVRVGARLDGAVGSSPPTPVGAEPRTLAPGSVVASMMLPPPARSHEEPVAWPTTPTQREHHDEDVGNDPSPFGRAPASAGQRATATPQRLRNKKQQAAAAPGGDEGAWRGRGRELVRGKEKGARGASAPPSHERRRGNPGIEGIGADIVTSADLVTSMQVTADGGIPLSGVPSNMVTPSTPGFEEEASPRASTAAVSPTARGTGTGTRKGKYQVKDSFNRLRGWINGGFASGHNRKNTVSRSPTPRAKGNPKGSNGRGFAERVIAGGDKANGRGQEGFWNNANEADKEPPGSGNRSNVGTANRVRKHSQVPHNAADRAARAEARIAERKALEAALEAGVAVARKGVSGPASASGGEKRSSTRTGAPAQSGSHRPREMIRPGGSPRASVHNSTAVGGNGVSPRATASGRSTRGAGGSPRATHSRDNSASSLSTMSARPPFSTSLKGTSSNESMSTTCSTSRSSGSAAAPRVAKGKSGKPVAAASSAGPMQHDREGRTASGSPRLAQTPSVSASAIDLLAAGVATKPRKCKAPASAAATAAAAVSVSPAAGRMVVGAMTPGGISGAHTTVPSRARTVKAAKSLGATVPPLSAASRTAAKGAGGAGEKSPRAGGGKGKPLHNGSGSKRQPSERVVEPSAASMKSPKGNNGGVNNDGSTKRTVVEVAPSPGATVAASKSGRMVLKSSPKKR